MIEIMGSAGREDFVCVDANCTYDGIFCSTIVVSRDGFYRDALHRRCDSMDSVFIHETTPKGVFYQ
jgi:hypothetical protein